MNRFKDTDSGYHILFFNGLQPVIGSLMIIHSDSIKYLQSKNSSASPVYTNRYK